MAKSLIQKVLRFSKSIKEWLPLASVVGLLIGYLTGYWYYYIYFGAFRLNIGDFFAASDYLGMAIDHIDFVFITLFSIPAIPLLVGLFVYRFARYLSSLEFISERIQEYIFAGVGTAALFLIILLILIVPSGIANNQAQLVMAKKAAVFDIYLNQNGEVFKNCGFIAASSRYTFCYDYAGKMPVVIANGSITKIVMTKPADRICNPDTCMGEAEPP